MNAGMQRIGWILLSLVLGAPFVSAADLDAKQGLIAGGQQSRHRRPLRVGQNHAPTAESDAVLYAF